MMKITVPLLLFSLNQMSISNTVNGHGFFGVGDDLIFYTRSECSGNNKDKCPSHKEIGLEDDLIIAVFEPHPRPSPTPKSTHRIDVTNPTPVPSDYATSNPSINIEEYTNKEVTSTSYLPTTYITTTTTDNYTTPRLIYITQSTISTVILDYNGDYRQPNRRPKSPELLSSETSTLVDVPLVMGIIAGALIAIILIILLIRKLKSRGKRSFKVDNSKIYQQEPNAALPSNTSGTNVQTQLKELNASGESDNQILKLAKRGSKDIRECYV